MPEQSDGSLKKKYLTIQINIKYMGFFSNLFGGGITVNLQSIIEEGAFLVDVRTPGEFAEGHVKGSANIPLDTVPIELAKFKKKKILLCSAVAATEADRQKLSWNKMDLPMW